MIGRGVGRGSAIFSFFLFFSRFRFPFLEFLPQELPSFLLLTSRIRVKPQVTASFSHFPSRFVDFLDFSEIVAPSGFPLSNVRD